MFEGVTFHLASTQIVSPTQEEVSLGEQHGTTESDVPQIEPPTQE
jgi:hypothetical protein